MSQDPPPESAQTRLRILSLEDEPRDAELIQAVLQRAGMVFDFHRVAEEAEFVAAVESGGFDLVLADYSLPGADGGAALRICHKRRPEWPFIFVSGSLGEEVATESLKQGAADFVLKGRLDRLPLAVERAVREARERAARRSAEKALRQSEERYRALFDRSLDCVYLMDFQGQFLDANQAALDLLGYQREDIATTTFASLLTEDQLPLAFQTLEEVRSTGHQKKPTEYRLRRKDQGHVFVETQSSLIYREGKPFAIQGIGRDITERKRAEAALRQQAALLEVSHDAILVWDVARGIQFMNPAAEELTGKTFAEAQSQELSAVLRARSGLTLRAAIQEVTTRGTWSGELALLTGNDKPCDVASRWTVLKDAHGKPAAVPITCNDITEKKHLEAQYLRAQRLESVGTLASGVAHDLNNILSPILMGVELLIEKNPDDDARSILNTIKESVCRGADTVRQLLTFARGANSQKGPVQPRHLVREIARLLQQTLPKNIQFYTDYAQEPATVLADPSQLHQVVMNLCVNARDAMPDGGVLFVTLENKTLDESSANIHPKARPIPYVVFKVSDSGVGIAPEILDRIFDPFFTTKPQGKGTGLGLATVLGIVESHGGFVLVESQPGQGTTFQVYIPASAPAEPGGSATELPSVLRGNGEVVLVVDDEPAIVRLAANVLQHGGYVALTAPSASEAVRLYEQNVDRIRLVLTDIMMPFGDGQQLATLLCTKNPKLPIVAMSGLATEELQRETMKCGALAFLRKPFTAEQLLGVLSSALKREPA